MSICYMLQKPSGKHDLKPLLQFGTPTSLFNRGFYPDDVEHRIGTIHAILDKRLSDFSTSRDYIVPMGDSCVVAAVTVWLINHNLLPATFLKYDRKLGGYYPIQIG